MNCHIIHPDSCQAHDEELPSLFLAGPIQGAPAWNERLVGTLSDLDINVFDPRRTNMDGFVYDEQVAWETQHLIAANVISFSFVAPQHDVAGRSYAQTSRFELGECLARIQHGGTGQKVVVFADPEYPGTSSGFPGTSYFRYKMEKEYPDIGTFFGNWDEYVEYLRDILSRTR